MEIEDKILELNEQGIYWSNIALACEDGLQMNGNYSELAVKEFQLADWLQELLECKRGRIKIADFMRGIRDIYIDDKENK